MRLSTTVLVTALCITVVNSIPVPEKNGLESQALDRLVMVEAEKDTALRNKRTIGILRQLFPEISQDVNPEAENRVSEAVSSDDEAPKEAAAAESQNNEIRVQFADEKQNEAAEQELAPLDDIEDSDDENRNKRFLNSNGSSGGGSGAGSGNFLFDIIRLVAGSGSSSGKSDPAAGAPSPGGGQEAVPGPITRLFVIANRGISNLIQDLILRLAATSERIVNFKARLITSII